VPGATLSDLPEWAADLLHAARVAHLGLLDGRGRPRVQPITFARVGNALYSAIDDKPKRRKGRDLARVKRLEAHPDATITVDRYDDDWTRLAWVQVVGRITVEDVSDVPLQALRARYEAYERDPPAGPLLKLAPELVVWWRASG
jgi:PPOX class probable F420-dependent enzyme